MSTPLPTNTPENEKNPERLSSSDKVLYLHDSINDLLSTYEIRHPKPNISKNTARKMLARDLYQWISDGIGPDEQSGYSVHPQYVTILMSNDMFQRNKLRQEIRKKLGIV